MKRMKKLFAILMTMAMVMGLGITASAANGTQQISVSGLASTGTNSVTYYKILTPDVNAAGGYKIADGVTLKGFSDAKAFIDAGTEKQKAALTDDESNLGTGTTVQPSSTTFTADVEAGYYAVFVTNIADDWEPEIIYTNPMIVSVDYDKATKVEGGYEYNAVRGNNNSVVAKYTTIPTTKTTLEDGVVDKGRVVTYTIKTYVPSYIEDASGAKYYKIKDTLTGAKYNRDSVEVKVGDDTITPDNVEFGTSGDSETLTITLTNYVEENAGKLVEITYDVTVTDTRVNNQVVPSTPNHTFDPDNVWLFTGAIKLTKTGVGEDADGLNDADFVVYRDSDKKFLNIKDDGTYEWVEDEADAEVFTTATDTNGNKGVIVIDGLDTGKYYFKEVEAPTGYSINTTDVGVTIDEDNLTSETVDTANPATTSMSDTKLASLPSTGGMGTTIFTIAGCVIMISAAGLFFASRRKAN